MPKGRIYTRLSAIICFLHFWRVRHITAIKLFFLHRNVMYKSRWTSWSASKYHYLCHVCTHEVAVVINFTPLYHETSTYNSEYAAVCRAVILIIQYRLCLVETFACIIIYIHERSPIIAIYAPCKPYTFKRYMYLCIWGGGFFGVMLMKIQISATEYLIMNWCAIIFT